MPLTITNVGTASSSTAGATLAVTGVTAAIGDALVLVVGADNSGTAGVSAIASVTDSAGNTWTNQGSFNQTSGVIEDGTTLGQYFCLVTAALSSGTVTVNFSPNVTVKTAALKKAAPAAGERVAIVAVGSGGGGSAATWSSGNVSVQSGDTIFAASAMQNGGVATSDADTTNGSWAARQSIALNTGTATTSQSITAQHKTVTATGNQSYDSGTGGAARVYAWNWLILTVVIEGPLVVTEATDVAAVSGWVTASGALAVTEATDTAAFAALFADVVGTLAATEPPDRASFVIPSWSPRVGTSSVRILVRLDWPDDQITRLWSGNGAFIDGDGEVWRGAGLITGLDELERAVNGEAPGFTATLSGLSTETSGKVWTYYQAGNLIDAEFRVLLQACDDFDQPQGAARVVFTGFFDNAIFDDTGGDEPVSAVSAEIVNKFSLRRTPNWAVLSDADQKARSAVLNPLASPDRFAERVSQLENKTVTWPRF